jgi:hypothetical protein
MRFKGEKAFSNQAEIVADKYFDAFKVATWPEDWINSCCM